MIFIIKLKMSYKMKARFQKTGRDGWKCPNKQKKKSRANILTQ